MVVPRWSASPGPADRAAAALDRYRLDGRTALVTGASGGLGRAIAERLARAGARVAICARRAARLDSVAAGIAGSGGDVLARPVDVTDAAAVDAFVREVEARWGPVSVLVNNASLLGGRGPLRDEDLDTWRRVLDVNLTGAFITTARVLPGMRAAGGGSIINVSSGTGDRPRAWWGAYGVSKRALEAFTYNLALEESDAGVRVNAVDPGAMRTAMRRAAYPEEDPGTLPEPASAVGVFLWLASDAAREVTGRRFRARDWSDPSGPAARAREQ